MKEFKILASQLPTVTGGVGNPRPGKLIIKFLFSDFSDPVSSMKLLLYPANDHGHYARQVNPIVINPIESSNVQVANSFTLGNNEIKISQLLKPVPPGPLNTYFFHYLILTPDTDSFAPDTNPHLIFHIAAYDQNGNPVQSGGAAVLAIDDSNPSPPKNPA